LFSNVVSRRLIHLFLVGAALASACSRQKNDAVQEPARPAAAKPVSELLGSPSANIAPLAPPSGAAPSVETAGSAAPSVAQEPGALAPNERQIVEDLQAALQAYYLKNVDSPNRFTAPRSLDELVRSGILKRLPNSPPGKKIVYHPENWLVTIE
jgi:hypothetical protein